MKKNIPRTRTMFLGCLVVATMIPLRPAQASTANIINNVQVTTDSQQIVNINESTTQVKRHIQVEVETESTGRSREPLLVELKDSPQTTVRQKTTIRVGPSGIKVNNEGQGPGNQLKINSGRKTPAPLVVPNPLRQQVASPKSSPGYWPEIKTWMKKMWRNIQQLFPK